MLIACIVPLLVLMLVIAFVWSRLRVERDNFVDTTSSLVANMNETPSRRAQFASALMLYDPRMMKYQDPRKYDFHTCGNATQVWKVAFTKHLEKASDLALEYALGFNRAVILFDQSNLVGNVIFVPIEGTLPQEVVDEIVFRKYIKWMPPANAISAIVPPGFRLRFEFYVDGARQQIETKYIPDGITKEFAITQPLKSVAIEAIN